jgi:hypothetical protein
LREFGKRKKDAQLHQCHPMEERVDREREERFE